MHRAGLRRPAEHARRLWLLFRVFAGRLGVRGYLNLCRFGLRRFVLGRRVPASVMIALTYECQCDCVHCAVASSRQEGRVEMTTAQVRALLEDARRLGAVKVGFTGGEPLLRGDIVELVRCAHALGLSNSIDTNGVRLDGPLARELGRAGVTNVNVSVDQPDARRHDRLRRLAGCHAAALGAVARCVEAGIPCVVSTYLTDRALETGGLEALVARSRALGATAVRVLFPIYSGKLRRRRRPLLSDENRRRFFRDFADGAFVCSESPIFDFLSGRMECCALRKLSVYVTPFGDVKSCYVSERSLGNLREARLPDILDSHRYLEAGPVEALDCQSC